MFVFLVALTIVAIMNTEQATQKHHNRRNVLLSTPANRRTAEITPIDTHSNTTLQIIYHYDRDHNAIPYSKTTTENIDLWWDSIRDYNNEDNEKNDKESPDNVTGYARELTTSNTKTVVNLGLTVPTTDPRVYKYLNIGQNFDIGRLNDLAGTYLNGSGVANQNQYLTMMANGKSGDLFNYLVEVAVKRNEQLQKMYQNVATRDNVITITTPKPVAQSVNANTTAGERPPGSSSQRVQELIQLARMYGNGYFSEFVSQGALAIAEKPDTEVQMLALALEREYFVLSLDQDVLNFGKPFMSALEVFATHFHVIPLVRLKQQAMILHITMHHRRAQMTDNLNSVIDYIDNLYNEEENLALFSALELLEDSLNTTEKSYEVLKTISAAVFAPYRRLNESKKQEITELINSYLRSFETTLSPHSELRFEDINHPTQILRRFNINTTRFEVPSRNNNKKKVKVISPKYITTKHTTKRYVTRFRSSTKQVPTRQKEHTEDFKQQNPKNYSKKINLRKEVHKIQNNRAHNRYSSSGHEKVPKSKGGKLKEKFVDSLSETDDENSSDENEYYSDYHADKSEFSKSVLGQAKILTESYENNIKVKKEYKPLPYSTDISKSKEKYKITDPTSYSYSVEEDDFKSKISDAMRRYKDYHDPKRRSYNSKNKLKKGIKKFSNNSSEEVI